MATEEELRTQHLDVYDTRAGPWNPDHGDIEIPEDWELLPTGDAFVSRTVKAAGLYWLAWSPRTRQRPHRRLIGLWRRDRRSKRPHGSGGHGAKERRQRKQGEAYRQRQEQSYQAELRAAILVFLDFRKAYQDLAEKIADEASALAAVVGSGRVGRTKEIDIEERAALAAKAYIAIVSPSTRRPCRSGGEG